MDIITIPLGIWSQKIKLIPYHKPSVEHQRRINPHMQELFKKETMKCLDGRVIYPTKDSSWVCEIQCC